MDNRSEDFNVADYLTTTEDIAAYLDEAFATGDPEFIMAAIGDVLKTKVLTEIAQKADIHRVSLHKAITEKRDVRVSNISGILAALGCRLSVVPKKQDKAAA